jgi:hypothetical protein
MSSYFFILIFKDPNIRLPSSFLESATWKETSPCIWANTFVTMLLQRQVSGNADLESVRDIRLRIISRETSLQRLAVFVPNLRELNLEGSCLGSLRYPKEHIATWIMSDASSVGIATGYWLDGRGSILGRGKKCFPLHNVQTGSGAHRAPYPMGTGGSPAGV